MLVSAGVLAQGLRRIATRQNTAGMPPCVIGNRSATALNSMYWKEARARASGSVGRARFGFAAGPRLMIVTMRFAAGRESAGHCGTDEATDKVAAGISSRKTEKSRGWPCPEGLPSQTRGSVYYEGKTYCNPALVHCGRLMGCCGWCFTAGKASLRYVRSMTEIQPMRKNAGSSQEVSRSSPRPASSQASGSPSHQSALSGMRIDVRPDTSGKLAPWHCGHATRRASDKPGAQAGRIDCF